MDFRIKRSITFEKIFREAFVPRYLLDDKAFTCLISHLVKAIRGTNCDSNNPMSTATIKEASLGYPEWVRWLMDHDFLEAETEEAKIESYGIGQHVFHPEWGEHLIAQVAPFTIDLFGVKSGRPWSDVSARVDNPHNISEEEMSQLPDWGSFTRERGERRCNAPRAIRA